MSEETIISIIAYNERRVPISSPINIVMQIVGNNIFNKNPVDIRIHGFANPAELNLRTEDLTSALWVYRTRYAVCPGDMINISEGQLMVELPIRDLPQYTSTAVIRPIEEFNYIQEMRRSLERHISGHIPSVTDWVIANKLTKEEKPETDKLIQPIRRKFDL